MKKEDYLNNNYLQMVLEASSAGIWEIDVEDRVVKFDNRIKDILNYNFEGNEITLEKWNDILRKKFNDKDYKKIVTEYNCDTLLNSIIYNRDSNIYIKYYAKPIYDESAKLIKCIGLMSVVEKDTKSLETVNKVSKTLFLSNMSHEIRTPLNAIIGMTNIAIRSEMKDETKKCLDNIKNASYTLLDIVNNATDISKLEVDELELSKEYFEIEVLLDNIYNIIGIKAGEKQQEVVFSIDANVPRFYIGDALRLTQAIINILNNAIKFSDEYSKIYLNVGVTTIVNNMASLNITISDEGIGMSEEQISKIFNPFEQGDNRFARKFGGAGLGLAISKQIVQLMNGEIKIDSEEGKGSTFTILVKIKIAECENYKAEEELNIENVDFNDINILLVDDVELNREIVKSILEHTRINIDEATDGYESVDKFSKNPDKYDMIIMDIQMPELDGYSATELIRKQNKDIPIIALSAHAFKEDEEKSIAIGMNDHIKKPVDGKILVEKILQYVNK